MKFSLKLSFSTYSNLFFSLGLSKSIFLHQKSLLTIRQLINELNLEALAM